MPSSQTVYLVYGPTAAGKSTVARQLAAQHNAVRFAIDDWMHALFDADRPSSLDLAWLMPRVARCQARIWATCEQILATGRDVVLELGLLRRADRAHWQAVARACGHQAALCFVDADRPTREARVQQRNAQRTDTFSFEVTPAMFAAMERVFERPDPDELRQAQLFAPEACHG